MSGHKCDACTFEAEQVADGRIAAPLPVQLKAPTQFYFESSALEPWGTDGVDDVGGVWRREFLPCDHIVGVHVAIMVAGIPVIATAGFEIFMYRRSEQRLHQARNPADFALISRDQRRSFRGGVTYLSDRPRRVYADNFGKGWTVGADWRSVSDRDTLQAPVLTVLYRKLTAASSEFEAVVEYQSCNK